MKKLFTNISLILAFVFSANYTQAQAVNPPADNWQMTLGGTIAWKGKKVRTDAWTDPSGGTMIFKIICDRTIDGVCFYADNGQSDTIVKKTFNAGYLPSGVINPSLPNFTLKDENGLVLHSGTLHSYWDNMILGEPLTTREYSFYFE